MGAIRQRKRWVFSLSGTCLTTKCTLHRVSYSCTLACIYMSEPRSVFFLVLTWHMNCSVSRLRRGTMLVLLVVPPPASSHITDSRSITRALQRTWELYFCRTRNIRWIFELKMQKTRFWNVYLPISTVLVLTPWSHSIEQLQNHGFPPSKNSAVRSEGDKYAFFDQDKYNFESGQIQARTVLSNLNEGLLEKWTRDQWWSIRYAGCCALIYSTDLSPQSANRVFPSISLDRNISFLGPAVNQSDWCLLSRAATLQLEMRLVPLSAEQLDPASPSDALHCTNTHKHKYWSCKYVKHKYKYIYKYCI